MRLHTANKNRRTRLFYEAQKRAREEFYERASRLGRNGHLDRLKRSGFVRRLMSEKIVRRCAL